MNSIICPNCGFAHTYDLIGEDLIVDLTEDDYLNMICEQCKHLFQLKVIKK